MAVTPQAALPITFEDRDPAVPGSGTNFNAAAMNPNFAELVTKLNTHTHSEFAGFASAGSVTALSTALSDHAADTTAIHGISDTSQLVYTGDARLSDTRTPTDGSVTNAKVAANAAIAYSKLSLAGAVKTTDLNFTPMQQDLAYATAATFALGTKVTGDTQRRFQLNADGGMTWGSGAVSLDAIFQRVGAGQLQIGTSSAPTTLNVQNNSSRGTITAAQVGAGYASASGAFEAYSNNVTTAQRAFRTMRGVSGSEITNFYIDFDGKLHWADPTTGAGDTNFYRHSAGILQTDGTIWANTGFVLSGNSSTALFGGYDLVTRTFLQTLLTGDGFGRYQVRADGKTEWGSGTSATDTNLYRSGVGSLKTDGSILSTNGYSTNNSSGTSNAYSATAAGDTTTRFVVTASGSMTWGDGTAARDTFLSRIAPGNLQLTNRLSVANAVNGPAFSTLINGDAQSRWFVDSSGTMNWGSGALAQDVTLSRSAAGQLSVSGNFAISAASLFSGKAATASSTTKISTSVVGDAFDRFNVTADGGMKWGSGAGSFDTTVSRSAVSQLTFTSEIKSSVASASSTAFSSAVSTDATPRWTVTGDGKMAWGDGTLARDAFLQRTAVGILVGVDTRLHSQRALSNSTAFGANVAGDANTRFQVLASGAVQWGDGTLAGDTFLTRTAAGRLALGNSTQLGRLDIYGSAATDSILSGRVGSDVNGRLFISADGKHQWGDGTSNPDTNLYRSGLTTLRTDGSFLSVFFQANPATATATAYIAKVVGDAQGRLVTDASGKMSWGDGTNASDANLYRNAVGQLKTDTAFAVGGNLLLRGTTSQITVDAQSANTNQTLITRVTADTADRYRIRTDGLLAWGDGTNAPDTNLYRVSSGSLKTDGSLTVVGGIALGGVATIQARQQTATTQISFGTRLASDTVDRFAVGADGTLAWGSGALAADTTLARTAAGTLSLGTSTQLGALRTYGSGTSSFALAARVTTDTVDRFQANADGTMNWGSGALATDTNLYRSAVGTLKTDTALVIGGTLSVTSTLIQRSLASTATLITAARITTDTQDRFTVDGSGRMNWGPGGATAVDTNLYRFSNGILKTDSSLTIVGTLTTVGINASGAVVTARATAAATNYVAAVTGESGLRMTITTDGKHSWGDGTLAQDTNLYRSAAARLATDHLFAASTLGLATKQKAGTPADADWAAAPPDATLVIDSTGSKIWARVNGVWKSAALV